MSGRAVPSTNSAAGEIVRVHDLSVKLPTGISSSVKAVRNVHLVVCKGQRVGIVGESGSGKSVTGRAIAGLLPESRRVIIEGSVQVLGREMVGAPERDWLKVRREIVSMVFQDPLSSLNPTMTVGRQVIEALGFGVTANKAEAAMSYLSMAGLPDPEKTARCYPFELSGGMRQRVLIAMALAKRPALIIADEPTTALDVTVQARVLATLNESVSKLQTALILISHDLAVVAKLCDFIYVMYRGEVVEAGPTLDIFTNPQHSYTGELQAGVRSLTSADNQLSGFRPSLEGAR